MALGTDHFTATDLAVMIPEVWGSKVNDFYRAKLTMTKFFTDRSDEVAEGGDTLYTPNITEMTANSKSAGSQVTLNSPTETSQTLVINNHFEVSFVIEDKEAAQVKRSYNAQERYMKNAAFTAAKKLEDAVATLFVGFSQSAGSTGVALGNTAILEAIELLTSADVDFEEAAWFLHPKTVWSDVMSIDRFALHQNTVASDPVLNGAVTKIYGRPVFASTRITKINTNADYAGALAIPDSIHYATANLPGQKDEMGVRLQASYVQEYLGTLVTADILYGVVENRDAGGVRIVSAV